ncbi:MAG: hypothetical protein NDJ89_15055 [Oligoflexia bacterium]|nr:hypothetical protein [Oligoflexia bacterium]
MKKAIRNFFSGALCLMSLTAPAALAAPSGAASSGQGIGVGVIFGEPTGITAKFWQGSRHAFDAGLAYSFDSFMMFYGDHLWHYPGAFGASSRFVTQLTPYFGVGGEVFFGNRYRWDRKWLVRDGSSAGIGLRIPLGIEWKPGNPPLGVFLEAVPGLGIIPGMFGFFQGGLGVRYYF